MTTPQQRIEADLKEAMKARETRRVATLRMLLSETKNERIRRGSEVDEAAFSTLVRKAIKQREEAAEQYRKGGRASSAAAEEDEAELLRAYLPRQAEESEIRRAIEELVAAQGLSGPGAMGPVMKEMVARFGARADGATLSRIARQVLAERG